MHDYAIIADIHGNSEALREVLRDIKKAGVTKLLIAGDFVGYYYRPDEVFALLREWEWQGVSGNHDTNFKRFIAGSFPDMDAYRKEYGQALDVAKQKMSDADVSLMRSLPETRELSIDGKRVLLCHGSPWSENERVYPDAPESTFARIASLGFDVVILAHTHYPFLKQTGSCTVLNPGSVGQPRDEGSVASWASADFETGEMYLHKTPFNPEAVLRDARTYDPSCPYLSDVLTRKQKKTPQ